MPDITLEPGESQKIVSQPPAGTKYDVAVSNTDVYLSHNSAAIINQGRKVKAGDRVALDDLRGTSVFAKNPSTNTDDVVLNVTEASFNISFQPRGLLPDVGDETAGSAPASSDGYDDATGEAVDIGSGGSTTEVLTPPGRADQVSIHVEGGAAFDVTVTWNNTSETYSSDTNNNLKEVLPVYYVSDGVDVQITDTSGGTNTVDYDMAVV